MVLRYTPRSIPGAVLAVLALTLAPALAAPASTAAQQAAGDATASITENPDRDRYIRPSPEIERILRTDKSRPQLRIANPQGTSFLVPHVTELSTLELMSRETYRLAGMELRPESDRLWSLDTWGTDGFRFYDLERRRFVDVSLPEGAFYSDFVWSQDGSRVAFLAHLPTHTEVWTADAATGRARSLSDAPVLATLAAEDAAEADGTSSLLQWTPEGTVLALLVPEARGAEPVRNRVPSSPVVRRTRPEPMSTRTYPFLLEDEHDERLFEFYTTSQLAELAEGRAPRPIREPAMWSDIALSPDGRHIMATRTERPFSYRVYHGSFPETTVVLDRQSGGQLTVLAERGLRESGWGDDYDRDAPRDFQWRPDGAGLSFLAGPAGEDDEDEGDDTPAIVPADTIPGAAPPDTADAAGAPLGEEVREPGEGEVADRILLATAPFDLDAARVVAVSDRRLDDLVYSLDGRHAFAEMSRNGDDALVHFDLTAPAPEPEVVLEFTSGDDPTELTGDLLTERTANGIQYAVVSSDGGAVYLEGPGYAEDFRPTPFIDRVAIADGSKTRVFEGAKDHYDRPLVALDPDLDRMIVSRESPTDYPDSYLWTRAGGFGENLTRNVDPFPEITDAERIDFSFDRRDGVTVHGRVSMPLGWERGDPPVPAIFWTYPREYEEAEEYGEAAVRGRNLNEFNEMSWLRWSDIWLAAGYALVHPDIPIIGENYNDTYIASLVDAMYGAIRAVDDLGVIDVDRIGHGGHSYGAFATANILANAPFFKAGIAGDGAYNRTLTPAGFQAERRSLWEAPHTYVEMSPFFRADQIETPLLMYHGGDDDNSGTFPIQSRRMIHALTALGKTAVLYEYPYESHTPRAMATKLDMWARFIDWFDTYVKSAQGEVAGGGGAVVTTP